jgi:hypothetical protein
MGGMGVPAVAERHFRTSLADPASAGPCPVSAGHRGRGYPGIYQSPLQRFPIPIRRWGVVKR